MSAIILTGSEGEVGMPSAIEGMQQGVDALEIVERGIRPSEADPKVRSVGFGGAPNMLGEMEFDASVMDGSTLKSGSIGALQGFLHPISVARQVMHALPHVMLVGAGARRFAEEIKAEKQKMLSPEARVDYEKWLSETIKPEDRGDLGQVRLTEYAWSFDKWDKANKDTVVFIVKDKKGNIAAGSSSSGWPYKYPGRLGDAPIIGAGVYADTRYGACCCTHTGEMTIRACTARSVVLYMKRGASVKDACYEALEDLGALQGGYLGVVVIHAIDAKGQPFVIANGERKDGKKPRFTLWSEEGGSVTSDI